MEKKSLMCSFSAFQRIFFKLQLILHKYILISECLENTYLEVCHFKKTIKFLCENWGKC